MYAILLTLMTTASFAAGETLLERAQRIEDRMDQVRPVFPDSKSAPEKNLPRELKMAQVEIADAVSELTNAAAEAKPLPEKTLEAIVHVIVRDYLYEQMPDAISRKFLDKYAARIDKVLNKFEAERTPFEKNKPFDEGRIERVRVQLAISTGALRGTTSTKPAKTNKTGKGKSRDDGAALSPCDIGVDCPAVAIRTLTVPAKKGLIRLPSTAIGDSTAARD